MENEPNWTANTNGLFGFLCSLSMCALRWAYGDIVGDSVYVSLRKRDRAKAIAGKNHPAMRKDSRTKNCHHKLYSCQPRMMIEKQLGRMCANNCAEKFTSSANTINHHASCVCSVQTHTFRKTRFVRIHWTIILQIQLLNNMNKWKVLNSSFERIQNISTIVWSFKRWSCEIHNCFFLPPSLWGIFHIRCEAAIH